MARRFGKLHYIDETTFQSIIKKEDGNETPSNRWTPRSSKYKNHHSKPEQQLSLLDFVIKPRQSQKQIKARKLLTKRPHLTIAKGCITTRPKRKGKTRLNPRKKVTKLKKSICSYRTLKMTQPAEEICDDPPTDSPQPKEQDSRELQVDNQLESLQDLAEIIPHPKEQDSKEIQLETLPLENNSPQPKEPDSPELQVEGRDPKTQNSLEVPVETQMESPSLENLEGNISTHPKEQDSEDLQLGSLSLHDLAENISPQPKKQDSLDLQLESLSLLDVPENVPLNSVEEKDATGKNKPPLKHSRRFRSYCDNCTRPRLKELSIQLLKDLDRFQKRAFAKNEIKARAHPRLVLGFREASSRLRINKVKLLLLATDCEICPGESGLDETIEGLKFQCQQHNVPYCFSLVRRELAYTLQKRAQISCVAILDYDGANTIYADLLTELEDARLEYKRRSAS